MALIKCPECGRENVSDSAEMCPGCGYGIKAYFDKVRLEEEQRKSEEEKRKIIEQKRQQREAEIKMKSKEIKILLIFGSISIALMVIIGSIVSKVSHDNEIAKYCDLSSFEVTAYSSEQDCLLSLLACKQAEDELKELIVEDFDNNKEKISELQKELENNFYEKAEEIISNFEGTLQFSSSDIITTLHKNGSLILWVGDHYNEGNYRWAFSSYLSFFTDTYVEDCTYYIVNTAYPETFSEGIRDSLLAVGIQAWGDEGERMLDETLTYIDSTPEGRKNYILDIVTANKQLYERNEATGNTVNGKKPPAIGMTAEEIRRSTWGSPSDINKTTYSWGTKEQWCYLGNRYIYLENGIVTSISE